MCVAISLTDIKKHPAKEKYINRELSRPTIKVKGGEGEQSYEKV